MKMDAPQPELSDVVVMGIHLDHSKLIANVFGTSRTFNPQLATRVGLFEAVFLQQLHWLLAAKKVNTIHDHKGEKVQQLTTDWIYNSIREWHEKHHPYVSQRTVHKVILSLTKQNLILTTSKFNKFRMDRTLWYTLNTAEIAKVMGNYI